MSGNLRLKGATSGSSQLSAPDTGTDQEFVFPANGGTIVTDDFTGDVEIDGRITGKRLDIKGGEGGSPATCLAIYDDNNIETTSITTAGHFIGTNLFQIDHSDSDAYLIASARGASSDSDISLRGHDEDGDETWSIQSNTGTVQADRELTIGTWADNDVPAVQIGKTGEVGNGIVKIKGASSNKSALSIRVNGNSSDDEVANIKADGRAYFQSGKANNFELILEPDNPANWVSTTDADGEAESVYNGPVLDVKALLLGFQSKIQSLEAEIQALKGGAS